MRGSYVRLAAVLVTSLLTLTSGCGGGFDNKVAERSAGPKTFANYVALGDGFASGPYLGPDVSGTGCLRSAENYPAQVARTLDVATVTDVTCSGATTKSLTSTSNAPNSRKKLAPQLDAVTKDTDLVTIGIGIEDNGLLQNMFRVCPANPCNPNDVLYPGMADQLDAYASAIASAVRTIQDIAPTATIVIVGYPQLMPQSGVCRALPPMSDDQLTIAFGVLGQLNNFLRAAAFQTGASFIDVAKLSADKTACSADPWVNSSLEKKGRARAFHPVGAEQDAVAAAVADQVQIVSSQRR